LAHLGWVGPAVVVGFLGKRVVALYRISRQPQSGSAALRADGMHCAPERFDVLAWSRVLLRRAGISAADPIVGLAIAGVIGVVLIVAARDVLGRLLDRGRPELVDQRFPRSCYPPWSPRGSAGQDAARSSSLDAMPNSMSIRH